MSNIRNTQIAKIKIAKKDLGMDDDTYRDMLEMLSGKRSAADLDFHERNSVLQENKLRWKPKRKKVGPKARTRTKARPKASQGDKIRALWLELAELGIVKNKSEAALMGYIKRMTKGQYEAPQFCDEETASRVIESLKQWRKRALDARNNHV